MSARGWTDAALPVEQRVSLLLAEMTVAEKVGQLHQPNNVDPDNEADRQLLAAGAISSSLFASGATAGNLQDAGLDRTAMDTVQRIAVEESRLGIPILFARDVIHGHRTIYPIPLGLASAWNPELARECAAMAAAEAASEGIAWTFAPMVDISEEPRWGRVAESLGEAPVLVDRLTGAMIRGFQDDRGVAACAKHFCGYGMVQGGRDYNTVLVGENTLRNLHLRPFKAAVDAGVHTVMAAFNDIDGVPMHAHRHYLREVLKGEWGFDGIVVADWNGVGQLISQGVAADLRDATRLAITAGVDLDMASGGYHGHLGDLVESGEVPIEVLDDAVRRVLRTKFRLGLFERPFIEPGPEPAPTAEHRALARRAAVESMVLVKNDGILPLHPNVGTVHLAGPFGDEGSALMGTWVLDGRPEEVSTPAQAFAAELGDDLLVSDGRFSDLAIQLVRQAEVTVALVGEHPSRSGEDRCISTLELPAGQMAELREMAALGKPLVVVVFTGRPLELGPVMEIADAVLIAWHPGTETGPALADLIFGRVSPSGRLPMTFPRSVGHIPSSTLERPTGRPVTREEDPSFGRYLNALVHPELTFGYGLGYGSFSYSPLEISKDTLPRRAGAVRVSVRVTNTGRRPAREVVQLYVHDVVAEVTRPLVELADWRCIDLEPGQERTVTFKVTAAMFGYTDQTNRWRVDPGAVDVIVGPNAARGERVRLTIL